MNTEYSHEGNCWFVGATFGRTEDRTARFVAEGIWEIRTPTDRERNLVRTMRVNDRIAIKASYTRKSGLPFDARGNSVLVMAIKAIGVVIANAGDGERVQVRWTMVDPVREWYFYTYRHTIWPLVRDNWQAEELIAFTFGAQPQDIDRFRNAPYWRERFGTDVTRFAWTAFYESIADRLLQFRHKRPALIAGLQAISARVDGLGYLSEDRYANGSTGFIQDVCPFTVMGAFNRKMTDANRRKLAVEIASFLGVDEPIPPSFEGVPLLDNRNSWFFPYEDNRQPDHIDSLWQVFAAGMAYADSDQADARDLFIRAFNDANGRLRVAWNLTFGLFWIRPWSFPSLDSNSQAYVTAKLGVSIGLNGPKKRCSGEDYLKVIDAIEPRFGEDSYPVHSFPELSFEAWHFSPPVGAAVPVTSMSGGEDDGEGAEDSGDQSATVLPSVVPYFVDDILREGCFLERQEIERFLLRLKTKKNLIIQGPPGTGKTWLAKRLACALIGARDDSKLRSVQFHPNLSYEDFVRGWRPAGDGKLVIAEGVFMEAIAQAALYPMAKFVVVIEEINRGNPAQIFGELLTLLEAGKRTPTEAIELCYPAADGSRRSVHIPENLYVIGTMNIADRSLALVDLALRRRFAFVTLEPRLGAAWRDWVDRFGGIDPALAADIEQRIEALNGQIANDTRLGKQFCVGHSYVTPSARLDAGDTQQWFREVVETEIGPLLDEYWTDSPGEAEKARSKLLQGW